jgi:hypothetical protein
MSSIYPLVRAAMASMGMPLGCGKRYVARMCAKQMGHHTTVSRGDVDATILAYCARNGLQPITKKQFNAASEGGSSDV